LPTAKPERRLTIMQASTIAAPNRREFAPPIHPVRGLASGRRHGSRRLHPGSPILPVLVAGDGFQGLTFQMGAARWCVGQPEDLRDMVREALCAPWERCIHEGGKIGGQPVSAGMGR
jgi:hypothetical protein